MSIGTVCNLWEADNEEKSELNQTFPIGQTIEAIEKPIENSDETQLESAIDGSEAVEKLIDDSIPVYLKQKPVGTPNIVIKLRSRTASRSLSHQQKSPKSSLSQRPKPRKSINIAAIGYLSRKLDAIKAKNSNSQRTENTETKKSSKEKRVFQNIFRV